VINSLGEKQPCYVQLFPQAIILQKTEEERKEEKVYWKMCDRNQLAFNVHGHNCHVLHVVALSTVDMRLYLNDSLSIKT